MKRIHLFEFTDLAWYPQIFRRMQTDYLQFVATRGSAQQNLIPLMIKAMQHAGTTDIVDLCSGGTGPWLKLQEQFVQAGWPVNIQLTDKYPHPDAVQKQAGRSKARIQYLAEPVDATEVPSHLNGMRTLFEGFHHFKPEEARSILQDTVERRAAIGIFEMSLKPPLGIPFLLLSPLTTILSYLLLTPFIRPYIWSRLLWTYLIPVVPLVTCWDGVISLLRVYSQPELKELTDSLDCADYAWEMGKVSTGTPIIEYTYLLGYPAHLAYL